MKQKQLYSAPETEVLVLSMESGVLIGGSGETRGMWNSSDDEENE